MAKRIARWLAFALVALVGACNAGEGSIGVGLLGTYEAPEPSRDDPHGGTGFAVEGEPDSRDSRPSTPRTPPAPPQDAGGTFDASSSNDAGSTGDAGSGGDGGTQDAGGNTVAICPATSKSYLCGGSTIVTLSSTGGNCVLVSGSSTLVLAPNGAVLQSAQQIGTWSGTAQSFTLVINGQSTNCTPI